MSRQSFWGEKVMTKDLLSESLNDTVRVGTLVPPDGQQTDVLPESDHCSSTVTGDADQRTLPELQH